MSTSLPPPNPAAQRRRNVFFKIGGICLLVGLLEIPLFLIRGVLTDRQKYQAEAVESISALWGHEQLVDGPILAVPYAYQKKVEVTRYRDGTAVQVTETGLAEATAYFMPETLNVSGEVTPELRRRGIYSAVVYGTRLELSGSLKADFAAAGIEAERIDWDKARVLVGVSDIHGVRSVSALKVTGLNDASFDSAEGIPGAFLPLAAKLEGVGPGMPLAFTLELKVQGSKRLDFAPVGRTTVVSLRAPWPDPSFVGASLPFERKVGVEGFRATWQTSHLSHEFPTSWTDRTTNNVKILDQIGRSGFGVRFALPLGGYGMVERAEKYAVLFFVLIFAVFFVFETNAKLRIHPFQYALVGAALCLFFMGFLALSEFWPIAWAYATAATACTALVSFYAWNFLRTHERTLTIVGELGVTYGYLYFVLQSQDYALLAGTIALFGVMALVMFCTRRVDWYAVDVEIAVPEPPKLQ